MTEQQAALLALLDLQAVDSELHAIMVKAKSLQESEHVKSLLARRAQAIEAAKQLDARGKEAASAVDGADTKVREIQARIDRDSERLNHGGTAKDLMGIQHEIDTLTKQRGHAEDAQYQAMEHAEAVAADREQKLPLLRAADAQARDAVSERDRGLAELQDRHRELTAQRPERVSAVGDETLVARYDSLRNARGGGRIAVARFERETCGACGTHMSPGDAQSILNAPAGTIPTCIECSALLVR
ncbi:zinc ribbon domain-containing protein [Kocuria sp.]|uniref:zinc ribbon domain-containing protein n=1 Tax=Kocuria sp. TaxID=1871328 RepID=UPI0026DF1DDA|nr:hypothetical protein [Kocuria sp.]MDO5366304.1 hypothetical protein [Kocuria sp.]